MRPEPVSQWAMNAHIGLCSASALSTVSAVTDWPCGVSTTITLFGFGLSEVGGKLLGGRGLHADGQRVDAGERAVRKRHDLVAGQDQRQHAIEAREARAGDAVGVDVLGAPQLAQHLLGFEHAAQHVLLHVIGDAGLGEAFEHARVGVPRPWAGGKGFRDVKLRINRHFRNPSRRSNGRRSNNRHNRLAGRRPGGKSAGTLYFRRPWRRGWPAPGRRPCRSARRDDRTWR